MMRAIFKNLSTNKFYSDYTLKGYTRAKGIKLCFENTPLERMIMGMYLGI